MLIDTEICNTNPRRLSHVDGFQLEVARPGCKCWLSKYRPYSLPSTRSLRELHRNLDVKARSGDDPCPDNHWSTRRQPAGCRSWNVSAYAENRPQAAPARSQPGLIKKGRGKPRLQGGHLTLKNYGGNPSSRTALPFKIPGITSDLNPASSKSFIQRSGVMSG